MPKNTKNTKITAKNHLVDKITNPLDSSSYRQDILSAVKNSSISQKTVDADTKPEL